MRRWCTALVGFPKARRRTIVDEYRPCNLFEAKGKGGSYWGLFWYFGPECCIGASVLYRDRSLYAVLLGCLGSKNEQKSQRSLRERNGRKRYMGYYQEKQMQQAARGYDTC